MPYFFRILLCYLSVTTSFSVQGAASALAVKQDQETALLMQKKMVVLSTMMTAALWGAGYDIQDTAVALRAKQAIRDAAGFSAKCSATRAAQCSSGLSAVSIAGDIAWQFSETMKVPRNAAADALIAEGLITELAAVSARAAWRVVFNKHIEIQEELEKKCFPRIGTFSLTEVLEAVPELLDIKVERFKQMLPAVQIYYALAVREIVQLTGDKEIQTAFQDFLARMELREKFKAIHIAAHQPLQCTLVQSMNDFSKASAQRAPVNTPPTACDVFPSEVAGIIVQYAGSALDMFFAHKLWEALL